MSKEAEDHWARAVRALKTAGEWTVDDPDGCVSRAYYAAFHAVSALLASEGKSFVKHMKKDPAIEKIRKTRHQISQKYGHDTRALIAHYRSLETKYADRMVRESAVEYSTK